MSLWFLWGIAFDTYVPVAWFGRS